MTLLIPHNVVILVSTVDDSVGYKRLAVHLGQSEKLKSIWAGPLGILRWPWGWKIPQRPLHAQKFKRNQSTPQEWISIRAGGFFCSEHSKTLSGVLICAIGH